MKKLLNQLLNKKYKTIILSIFILFLSLYLLFFDYIDTYHKGLSYNSFNGNISLQEPGFHFSGPWTSVSKIDIRPMRVCVSTSGKGFNCKLIQFDPVFYNDFVAVEGHKYYWLSNRFSFNFGYDEEYRGMKDILRGHAYGTKQYKFVKILKEKYN